METPAAVDGGVPSRIEFAFTPPFDADAVLGSLHAHAIPGAEIVTENSIRRVVLAPSGPVVVTVTLTTATVSATIDSVEPADVDAISAMIRRWFDLDLRPVDISEVLGDDPIVGPLVAARPGLRVLGAPHGFETAVMAVLGQQVSLARARALGGKVVAEFGTPGPGGIALFPTPDALASVPIETLRAAIGLTGARARAVHSLATACVEGLELASGVDPERFRAGLLAIPGIGPWTADYLAVRVLGDRDAFTAGDLVLRRALGRVNTREAQSASEAWRPYRAYALFHLWTATAY